MQTDFTEDDLILFIYNELDSTKKLLIEQALDWNLSLQAKYNNMKNITGKLDSVFEEPNPTSVDIILESSHFYEEHSH